MNTYTRNTYDGSIYRIPIHSIFIEDRRAEDGICGPDAKLYKPNLTERMKNAIKKLISKRSG